MRLTLKRWKNFSYWLNAVQQFKMKSSTWDVKVVCNGTPNTVSLVLVGERKRYIFNAGEGVHKYYHEWCTRVSMVENIFLTSTEWKNTAGMSGFLITLDQVYGLDGTFVTKKMKKQKQAESSDSVSKRAIIKLHGPSNLDSLISYLKRVTPLKNIYYKCEEMGTEDTFIDDDLTIKCIRVRKGSVIDEQEPKKSSTSEAFDASKTETNMGEYSNEVKRKGSESNDHEQPLKKQKTSVESKDNPEESVCWYICETKPVDGKLDIVKCLSMGMRPGPQLKLLKSGQDVTLDNGTVILAKDVVGKCRPGKIFMVIDCPSEEYLNALTHHPVLKQYQGQENLFEEKEFVGIFHITPEHVLNNPQYQQWMKLFPSKSRHIILNEENKIFRPERLQFQLERLTHLQPVLYPPFPPIHEENSNAESKDKPDNIIRATLGMTIQLLPQTAIIPLEESDKSQSDLNSGVWEWEEYANPRKEYQDEIKSLDVSRIDPNKFPQILFLGTGSAASCIIRNASGILIRVDEQHSLLFDCGEGMVQQLYHVYGAKKALELIPTLKSIFVSHRHSDHLNGLIGVLMIRAQLTKEPCYLLTSHVILEILKSHPEYNSFKNTLTPVAIDQGTVLPNYEEICKATNLKDFATLPVDHTRGAHAIRIQCNTGETIAFSGDTRPCDQMVKLAQNVDVLIHEATFADECESDAKLKKHSTVSDAIGIARRSNAKHTILTHFSQRYAKEPVTPKNMPKNIYIANDFLKVNLESLPLASKFHLVLPQVHSKADSQIEAASKLLQEKLTKN